MQERGQITGRQGLDGTPGKWMQSPRRTPLTGGRKFSALQQEGKQRTQTHTEGGGFGGGKIRVFPPNCFYFPNEIKCKVIGCE